MIVFTVTRVSGILLHDKVDNVWEVYWQSLAAETGLILTAMTAFRTLFVSSRAAGNKPPFWHDLKSTIRKALNPWSWLGRSSTGPSHVSGAESADSIKLPSIPGGTLTGVRTFIRGRGRSSFLEAAEGQEENVPLKEEPWQPHNSIAVRHDLSTRSEHVCKARYGPQSAMN